MTAQENILIIRPKTLLTENRSIIHSMRFSKDSLKLNQNRIILELWTFQNGLNLIR